MKDYTAQIKEKQYILPEVKADTPQTMTPPTQVGSVFPKGKNVVVVPKPQPVNILPEPEPTYDIESSLKDDLLRGFTNLFAVKEGTDALSTAHNEERAQVEQEKTDKQLANELAYAVANGITQPWTAADEKRMAELRDDMWAVRKANTPREINKLGEKYAGLTSSPTDLTNYLKNEYNALYARRNPYSAAATENIMPEDPYTQTRWTSTGLSAAAGLTSGLENVKNAAVLFGLAGGAGLGMQSALDAQQANAFRAWVKGDTLDDYVSPEEVYEGYKEGVAEAQKVGAIGTPWTDELMGEYEKHGVDGVLGVWNNSLQAATAMLPVIAGNAIAPGSGMYILFSTASAGATVDALNAGLDIGEASMYGLVKGGIEVATEKITGGIPGLGAGGLDTVINRGITSFVKSNAGRIAVKQLANMAGEGLEEYISAVAGAAVDKWFGTNPEYADKTYWETLTDVQKDALYSALTGAITGALLNASSLAVNPKGATAQTLSELSEVDETRAVAKAKNVPYREAAKLVNDGVTLPDVEAEQKAITDALVAALSNPQTSNVSPEIQAALEKTLTDNGIIATPQAVLTQAINNTAEAQETPSVTVHTPQIAQVPYLTNISRQPIGSTIRVDGDDGGYYEITMPPKAARSVAPVGENSTIRNFQTVQDVAVENNLDTLEETAAIEELPDDVTAESPEGGISENEQSLLKEIKNPEVENLVRGIADGTAPSTTVHIPAEIAGLVTERGVNFFKDLQRNLEAASGGNKTIYDFFENNIQKPLLQGKANYIFELRDMLTSFRDTTKRLGIEKGSEESAAAQWYGEGVTEIGEKYTLTDLKKDFPDKWKNIVELTTECRRIYDEYVGKINASLRYIYPTVEKEAAEKQAKLRAKITASTAQIERLDRQLSDAYRDITNNKTDLEEVDAIKSLIKEEKAKLRAAQADLRKLDADIESGELYRNKRLKPRKDYFHHSREMAEGIAGLSNILTTSHEIDPKLVGKSEFTKPNARWTGFMQRRNNGEYTADAVGSMVDYIPAAEYKINIDPVTAQLRGVVRGLVEATANSRNANGLISLLTEYANSLAGKTNKIDRADGDTSGGRKLMAAFGWLNGRVKSNVILGNVRSALVQVANLTNAATYILNPVSWTKGALQMFRGDLSSTSPFLTERYSSSFVDAFDPKHTPKQFAKWLLEIGDKTAAKLIWNSAYQDALAKKIDDPVSYADNITRRSIAGRGIGELPIALQSKLINLAAPFQVEINNSFNAIQDIFSKKYKSLTNPDTPTSIAVLQGAQKVVGWAATSWIVNHLISMLTGQKPLPDLIDAVVDAFRGIDDEKSAIENTVAFVLRLTGEAASIIPFSAQLVRMILGEENSSALFGDEDPTRYGSANIGTGAVADAIRSVVDITKRGNTENEITELITSALTVAMPWGGAQLGRTAEGIYTVARGGEKNATGALKYAIDNKGAEGVGNYIKAALFGKWALGEAQAYIDRGFKPEFSAKWTEARETAVTEGVSIDDFDTFYHALMAAGGSSPTQDETYSVLSQMPFSNEQRRLLWRLTDGTWVKSYDKYEAELFGNG